jgi:hypothetical protein
MERPVRRINASLWPNTIPLEAFLLHGWEKRAGESSILQKSKQENYENDYIIRRHGSCQRYQQGVTLEKEVL